MYKLKELGCSSKESNTQYSLLEMNPHIFCKQGYKFYRSNLRIKEKFHLDTSFE